jgi:hypothetical protein
VAEAVLGALSLIAVSFWTVYVGVTALLSERE